MPPVAQGNLLVFEISLFTMLNVTGFLICCSLVTLYVQQKLSTSFPKQDRLKTDTIPGKLLLLLAGTWSVLNFNQKHHLSRVQLLNINMFKHKVLLPIYYFRPLVKYSVIVQLPTEEIFEFTCPLSASHEPQQSHENNNSLTGIQDFEYILFPFDFKYYTYLF